MVADDLRAALITATSPNGHDVSHRLARTLGHLAYARRFLLESRGHYEVAAAHAPAGPGRLGPARRRGRGHGRGGGRRGLRPAAGVGATGRPRPGTTPPRRPRWPTRPPSPTGSPGTSRQEAPHERLRHLVERGGPPRPGRRPGHRGLPGVRRRLDHPAGEVGPRSRAGRRRAGRRAPHRRPGADQRRAGRRRGGARRERAAPRGPPGQPGARRAARAACPGTTRAPAPRSWTPSTW